ncbi:MAG TPA: dTMP kinase [Gemmatimonadaceae bacterium]|nr:dTMP kinase [Gemmatimonadaceae bacterium]
MAIGRGLFISIEGGEGAGKTAQCRALAAHLERRGEAVRVVREPGGTELGEQIRQIVLFTRDLTLTPEAEALLFSTARAQLTREVIRPALEMRMHVIADRFFDSTIAYQGYGGGADLNGLRALTRFAVGETLPDLTFLLDLPIETARARAQQRSDRWDRIEAHDGSFHERVRHGYLAMAREEPSRWVVLDATHPEVEVTHLVMARVDQELERRSNRIPTRR